MPRALLSQSWLHMVSKTSSIKTDQSAKPVNETMHKQCMSVAINWANKLDKVKCDISAGFPISSYINYLSATRTRTTDHSISGKVPHLVFIQERWICFPLQLSYAYCAFHCNRMCNRHTANVERFVGLNFCNFHSFQEYHKSFPWMFIYIV